MTTQDSGAALVVTTFGRRVELRLDSGTRVTARIKGRKLRPVCGDRVQAQPIDNESEWLVTEVLPRTNELSRPDARGRREVLAANVSLVVVVVAQPPKPDWYIVDRYLSAAELIRVPAVVAFNKADLAGDNDELSPELQNYRQIGYAVVCCSAKTGAGLGELGALLRDHTAIFVGQSGVGKSTIINALSSDALLRTGAVSDRSGEGKHTTVNSALVDLDDGGAVIDSPGVRDYAPAVESPDRVETGFREIVAAAANCRYSNCRHRREPDCAVKAQVDAGTISPRRYESYKRLLNLTEKFAASYR